MVNAINTSRNFLKCTNCAIELQPEAKFCGECGVNITLNSNLHHHHHNAGALRVPNQVSYDDLAKLEAFRLAQIKGATSEWAPTPTPAGGGQFNGQSNGQSNTSHAGAALAFASAAASRPRVNPALVNEMLSLRTLLFQQRAFLIMHWTIFLVANLAGFTLTMMCYHGYVGDEVTKMLMALTPLTFINAVALSCLAPINGTRREIARIKEKMQLTKAKMELGNLV